MYPLHVTRYMVMADRFAGYPSRSVVWNTRQIDYALVRKEDFDAVMQRPSVQWDDVHWLCLMDLLRYGDIWVAYFDCLFFRPDQACANHFVFRLIRIMGIRIVVAAHGGDVLHADGRVDRFDSIGRLQLDYPDNELTAFRRVVDARIRYFGYYAELILPADNFLARFVNRRDIVFRYFPVDCVDLRPSARGGNSEPLIVHAPNHRHIKGTQHLCDAVDCLQKNGIACELRLIERVARHEALELYRHADIIADQFCCGVFGMFALEGLALGKPVLTYLDQTHLGDPVFNLPVVNTNAVNMERVLAVLLEIPSLRERLGCAGRAAVERYQSVPALAEVWDHIYRHVWWGEPLDLEKTAHFSAERVPRSFTEDPSDAEFWPVPVDDLLETIRGVLTRLADSHATNERPTPTDRMRLAFGGRYG